MPNEQNLKGHEFTSDQSREEAARNGRKGGIASGRARRERRRMRDVLEDMLAETYVDTNGKALDGVSMLMLSVMNNAQHGDMRALEFIRDTVGEKPVERVETVEISEETYQRVAEALGD